MQPPKKLLTNLIGIDSARTAGPNPDPSPQPPANTAKANQYTRRSFIAMACLGVTERKIARRYRAVATEQSVAEAIKEELIAGGALQRLSRAA